MDNVVFSVLYSYNMYSVYVLSFTLYEDRNDIVLRIFNDSRFSVKNKETGSFFSFSATSSKFIFKQMTQMKIIAGKIFEFRVGLYVINKNNWLFAPFQLSLRERLLKG